MADLYYIEEGYYDAGYFVYTAVAAAAVSSTVTVSATTAKSVSVSQSMAVAVSLACTISHIEGADLVAFSNAAVTTSGDRICGISSTLSSVGSLSCNAALIPASNDGAADLSVSTSMTITVGKILSAESSLSVVFTQVSTPDYFRLFASTFESNITQEAAVRRIRNNNITASAAFDVAVDYIRTRSASSDDAVIFSFTANTARSRDHASSQLAAFSLAAAIDNRTRDQSAALSSAFSVTATISHIEGADLVAFAQANVVAINQRIRSGASQLTTASTLSADVKQFKGITQLIASAGTLTATATKTATITRTLSSAFTFFTDYDRIFAAPVAVSGGSYDTAVINTSTTKFGAGSLGWTLDADVQPTSNVFWTGTEFVAANTSFKWTSSNGVSWTRSSITGAKIPLNFGNGYYFNGNQYSTDLNTWNTITSTIPGSSGSYISSIGYTAGVYYIFTQYILGGRFRGGYASASTPGGSWTHVELYDGGTTGAGSPVQLVDFNQSNGLIAVVVTGTGSLGLYVNHFNGSTVTNIAGALPTLSINTVNFAYEQFRTVATKTSTQYLRSVRDTQNPRRDGIVYTNGASTGSFVFGTSGGSDLDNKNVINDIAFINNTWLVYASQGIYKSTATVPTSYSDFTLVSDQSLGTLAFGASKYVSTTFYSSDATTWTPNVPGNTTGYQGYLEYAQGDGSDLGNFSTIDFWAYVPDIVGGTTYSLMIVGQTNQTNYLQWGLSKTSGAAPFIRFNRVKGDVNDDQTNFVSSGDASQGWHHIRISASGSNLAVYYDGIRKIYRADAYGTFAGKLRIRSSELLIDDFLVSDTLITDPSVSSFTVPTTKSSKDANTDLLLRFDTNFSNEPDLAPVIPRATLVAQASLSAAVRKTVSAVSTLTSQFTQSASITVLVLFDADLSSQFTQTVEYTRVKFANSELASEFTVTANNARTRDTNSIQAAEFTSSTEAVKTASIASALDSQVTFTGTISHIHGADLVALSDAALTSTGNVTRQLTSAQSSEFTQTANNARTRLFNSQQTSEVTLSANAAKTTDSVSNISSASALAADNSRTRNFNSAIASEFTQTVIGNVTKEYQSDLSASVTFTAEVVKTADAVIATEAIATNLVAVVKTASFLLDSTVTAILTANLDGTLEANSNINSAFTQTADINALRGFLIIAQVNTATSTVPLRIKQLASAQSVQSSIVANATTINDIVVQASIESTLSTEAIKLNGFDSALSSAATVTANVDRIRGGNSQQTSEFQQQAVAVNTAQAVSNQFIQSEFSATISHIEGADLVISGFATLTAEVLAGKFAESSQSAAFTQTALVDRIRGFNSNQNSQFTVSAAASEIVQLASTISSQSQFTVSAIKTARATSNQTAQASVICSISHIESAEIVAENFASLTAIGSKITGFALTATSAVNLTATVNKIKAFSGNLLLSTSLSANAVKAHRGQATLQARATFQVNAGKRVLASATITSAMTFVANVREIDLDSINQVVYIIPREVWTYRIAEEIWTRTITPETRIYTIKEE